MIKVLITFCARGGSKGVPLKNIKELNGKPLMGYSIDTAKIFSKEVEYECHLAISTDSDAILAVAQKCGLITTYKRPEFLSTDSAGKVETIYHLLNYEESLRDTKYDYVLDLDISSPLRSVEDLKKAFEIMINSDSYNLFSVSKAHRNPYFNMVEKGDDGYYKLVKSLENNILSRQKAPIVYDLNASFYIYRRNFFDKGFNTAITPKSLIYEIPHICFDIDQLLDFEIMEFLIVNNKLDFQL